MVKEIKAGYSAAKGARAAARKVLGAEAAEGTEFKILEIDGGRFDWAAINKPTKSKGKTPVTKGERPAPTSTFPVVPNRPVKAAEPEAAPVLAEAQPEPEPDAPVVSAGASAFGAFTMQQLTAGNNATTSRAHKPTEPKPPRAERPAPEIVNGVRKPSAGTVCRAVWELLDAMVADGVAPDSKKVKTESDARNWNSNNSSIEYYQWRKFHGIKGRVSKAA